MEWKPSVVSPQQWGQVEAVGLVLTTPVTPGHLQSWGRVDQSCNDNNKTNLLNVLLTYKGKYISKIRVCTLYIPLRGHFGQGCSKERKQGISFIRVAKTEKDSKTDTAILQKHVYLYAFFLFIIFQ